MIKIYDIETFSNCFTYTDVDAETNEVVTFVISDFKDETSELKFYLASLMLSKSGMVGFNNLHFDWPVLSYILNNEKITGESIYSFAQTLIGTHRREYVKETIKQLDLFLLNHYDNKSRSTSLKSLEVALQWHDVMDMPFSHTTKITPSLLDDVLKYNLNDVLFTKDFYDKCSDKIELRKKIAKQYKIDVINKSDVVIGERIFLKYLADAMDISVSELSRIRGKRKDVPLNEIIFKHINFRDPNLNKILQTMKSTVSSSKYLDNFIKNLDTKQNTNDLLAQFRDNNIDIQKTAQQRKSFSFHTRYAGLMLYYGVGGLHACIEPGVYKSSSSHKILDIDVKSYYPNLFIKNNLHPRQMDQKTFIDVYTSIFNQRVEAQKKGDKLTSDALKLALNGVFGKTGSDVSCFYDPTVFYSITVNGQLLITMLVEMLHELGCDILQINTDGVTISYDVNLKDKIMETCAKWESISRLQLEYADYASMIIRDVNNYIAVSEDGKIKEKGAFETKKDWHKDNSFMIVPVAVREYFVNGTPIEETLNNHKNIFDFCGRYKAGKGWHVEYVYLKNNEETRENYGRTYRFLPVKQGGVSLKLNQDGRQHQLLDGYQTMPFNTVKSVKKKDLNFSFYQAECLKLMQTITPLQQSLF
jgi:hypothetical protein